MRWKAEMPLSSAKIPTRVLRGDRISREGKIRLGCSLILFNESRNSVLLTRRTDNDQWCLPGGMVDSGETVTEACEREMLEETGIRVQVVRLIGVYSDPDQLIVYPDGNKAFVIVLSFEVRQTGGELRITSETSDAQFLPVERAIQMNLYHNHAEHLRDALDGKKEAFIK